ncbi:claudin-10-like isoform X2 [Triplophysa rosa]|uniref:claudin-10-like isoform X2 n=1 Tax=Triplophysa rosa TaxID=992332 RepID=UPI002545FA0B|nr:claudin-10-like isoform X2 [Triplophysa rosa]
MCVSTPSVHLKNDHTLLTVKMRRTLIQVFGFLISTLGWLFISCTTAMDYWRVNYVGGKGAYVQGVRGLLMIGMSLGFVAIILCFIGMECTYIGGREKSKDKTLLSGAVFHFVGGLSSCAAYCLYTNRVASAAFSPSTDRSVIRYTIGTPIFLGLVGSFFIILGSVLYAVTIIPKRMTNAFRQRPLSGRSVRRTATKTHDTTSRDLWSGSHNSRTSHTNDEKISVRDTFV